MRFNLSFTNTHTQFINGCEPVCISSRSGPHKYNIASEGIGLRDECTIFLILFSRNGITCAGKLGELLPRMAFARVVNSLWSWFTQIASHQGQIEIETNENLSRKRTHYDLCALKPVCIGCNGIRLNHLCRRFSMYWRCLVFVCEKT